MIIFLLLSCVLKSATVEMTVDLVEENMVTVENPVDNSTITIQLENDHNISEGDKIKVDMRNYSQFQKDE